jgi:hypothetical protein
MRQIIKVEFPDAEPIELREAVAMLGEKGWPPRTIELLLGGAVQNSTIRNYLMFARRNGRRIKKFNFSNDVAAPDREIEEIAL